MIQPISASVSLCRSVRYDPYGIQPGRSASLLAFNGECQDRLTGSYLLGNGRRAYSPALRRFLSADRLSPFSQGGINGYAYCLGDPVNRMDPSGEFSVLGALKAFKQVLWVAARIKNFGLRNGTLKTVSELAKYGDKVGAAMIGAGITGGQAVLTVSLGVTVAVKTIKFLPTIRPPTSMLRAVGRMPNQM